MITEDQKDNVLNALPKNGSRIKRKVLFDKVGFDIHTFDMVIQHLRDDGEIILYRGKSQKISLNMDQQDSWLKLILKYTILTSCFILPNYLSKFDLFWEAIQVTTPFLKLFIGLLIGISAEHTLTVLYQKSALRYGFLRSLKQNRTSAFEIKINGNSIQTFFIALFHGKKKYLSNRFGIYKAFLPKWQIISRVICYALMVPPTLLLCLVGFLLSGRGFSMNKETLLLMDYYFLISSLMLVLVISQIAKRNAREASILLFHPKKKDNIFPLSLFFDFQWSEMEKTLTSEELEKFKPDHDQMTPLYVNIKAKRGDHGLYNQQIKITYSSSLPIINMFTP